LKTRYKILFALELLNEYYSNLQCRDFNVIASAETMSILKDHQILYKQVNNKVIVLIKVYDETEVDDVNKPFVPLETNQKLVFYLDLVQPIFMNITNIDFDSFNSKRFYFSNINKNKSDNILYLSSALQKYNDDDDYLPTLLVVNEENTAFECIQKTPDEFGTKHNTEDNNYWTAKGMFQYASPADMLPFFTRIRNYTVNEATEFTIKLFKLNSETNNTYDVEVPVVKNLIVSDKPIKDVQVDLSSIPAGRYRLIINDEPFEAYIDDNAVYRNYFGVIEIFNHLNIGDEFALLDEDGKVKEQNLSNGSSIWLNYVIRFANRLAFWEYISLKEKVTGIESSNAQYSFNAVTTPPPPLPSTASAIFLSNKPIPLNEKPEVFNIILETPVSGDPPKAPNPNPVLTGMLKKYNSNFYCNIYLNY
jgi:hypothetical protein